MSKLNCWVGCQAYIKAPYYEPSRGIVVTVLRVARRYEKVGSLRFLLTEDEGAAWVVESREPIRMEDGAETFVAVVNDGSLVPITPPPGTIFIDRVTEEDHGLHAPA